MNRNKRNADIVYQENTILFEKLIDEFYNKNLLINLSAIRDKDGIRDKHILDSLALVDCDLIQGGMSVCDIGTGGGFPLLPLAIAYPNTQFVGIDARKKKIDAVRDIVSHVGIANVNLVWGRCEEYKGKVFDMCIARGVAYIDTLIMYCFHLVKRGGYFVFYKMYSKDEEKSLRAVCKKYGLTQIKSYSYGGIDNEIQKYLYIIQKN